MRPLWRYSVRHEVKLEKCAAKGRIRSVSTIRNAGNYSACCAVKVYFSMSSVNEADCTQIACQRHFYSWKYWAGSKLAQAEFTPCSGLWERLPSQRG